MMEAQRDRMSMGSQGLVRTGHFMERLAALPLNDWAVVAMACPATIATASEQAMTAALQDPMLALDAWNVRDDVESLMCRFDCADGRRYVTKKGSRAHIKLVTARAALSVLAYDVLGATHFVVCYSEFERIIPVGSL